MIKRLQEAIAAAANRRPPPVELLEEDTREFEVRSDKKLDLLEALEGGERSGIAKDYSFEGLLAELDAEPE